MRTTIFILVLAAFFQTTVLPINLVLIILICRAYLRPEQSNLFLAFAFGLMTAYLTLDNLGFQSLTYLILVQLAQVFSKVRFFTHSFLIVPLTFSLLSINAIVNSSQILPNYLVESILSLPIFYLVKLWEERFIVPKDIKLKFR